MKEILVLGPGCAKCEKLYALAGEAVASLNLNCELKKISDLTEIIKYGIMITPALVVDGKVLFSGKIPSLDEIKKMLEQ
jgi:small redox-active disulfide protein 2